MTAPVSIKAFHQREERYQGLRLDYDGSDMQKTMILDAIADVERQKRITPLLNEFGDTSIYIEFHDEYDRDGGEFFTELLTRLGIHTCEAC